MEIRFCDLCNESVPLSDLREGRARETGARVICAACDLAMGGLAAPGAAASGGASRPASGAPARSYTAREANRVRTGTGPEWAAGFAILVAGGLGYLAITRVDEAEQRIAQALTERGQGIESLADSLIQTQGDFQQSMLRQRMFEGDMDRKLATLGSGWSDGLARLSGELEGVKAQVLALGQAQPGDLERDRRLEAVERQLGGTQREIQVLTGAVLGLSQNIARGVPVESPTPAGVASAPAAAQAAPLGGLLSGLSDPDANQRWTAVDALARLGDPAAAPHLVPLLRDSDIIVRLAAARSLGELQNPMVVPALIDALEDEEPSVRETACFSLRSLTGRNFKFDANEKADERKKRVQAWRDWWERTGSQELPSAPAIRSAGRGSRP